MGRSDMDAVNALGEVISAAVSNAPTLPLPSPDLVEYYNNKANRIILIEDDVDYPTLGVVKAIMAYNIEDKGKDIKDRKPIKIFINTPGGDVSVMWSVVRAIKTSKTPVYTYNLGQSLSAGSHILAAGHKRFAFPGSAVLIHSGSCSFSGAKEVVDSAKKFFDELSKKADEQLLADTKIDRKVFKKKASADWWISDEESVALGIVDKIITDFEELAD